MFRGGAWPNLWTFRSFSWVLNGYALSLTILGSMNANLSECYEVAKMTIDDIFSRGTTADDGYEKPRYSLLEFSRPEYSDPVVPVQMLMVMMGFMLVLFSNAFSENVDWGLFRISIICGTVYLLFFMFYLTEYYEKLWEPYFMLPEDKLFFRIYCLLIGVVVIAFMPRWPQFWPLYVIFLYLIMYKKKKDTRNIFQDAVISEYGNYDSCDNPKTKSQYVLVETFTMNFLWLGVVFLAPFALMISLSAIFVMSPELLNYFNNNFSTNITEFGMRWTFVTLNVLVTIPTLLFWSGKIKTGLRQMKNQIEAGHYAYFEARDLRGRIRRGRYVNKR